MQHLDNTYASLHEQINNSDLDPTQKYDIFINHIKSSIALFNQSNTPNIIFKKRSSPPAPWWNDECSKAVTLRKQALSTYRKNSSYQNFLTFKKQKALKKTFKKAKRAGWKSYCETLSPLTHMTAIWKTVKRFRNRFLNPLPNS